MKKFIEYIALILVIYQLDKIFNQRGEQTINRITHNNIQPELMVLNYKKLAVILMCICLVEFITIIILILI